MQAWTSFFEVTAGASATLLGLLFVSVSFNAEAILSEKHRGSRRLAEQAFQNFLAVLMVSLLALIPAISLESLGFSTLAVSAVWVAWVVIRLYQTFAGSPGAGSRIHALRRQLGSLFGFGVLVWASLRMAQGSGDSRVSYGAATIVLLFTATAVSWRLLLELAGKGAAARKESRPPRNENNP